MDERSDVDLLVTLPADKTGLALGALLMDVQDLLGRRVDVVTENWPASCLSKPGAERSADPVKIDPEADLGLLEHIRGRIARIEEYTNGERSRFYDSHLVQDAVIRNLQTIAESTQRLSDGIRATEPEVPWRAIAGFRNVLVHDYFEIDLEVVWSVVDQDLPRLVAAVARMTHVARTSQP